MGWNVSSAATLGSERGRNVNAHSAATPMAELTRRATTPMPITTGRSHRLVAAGADVGVPAARFFEAMRSPLYRPAARFPRSLRNAIIRFVGAPTHPFLDDLAARELIVDSTPVDELAAHLQSARRSAYIGFDPTADSLHVGNLLGLTLLRRVQLGGHRPIVLVGGGTGLIGDPSGKAGERALNETDTVREW